MRLTTRIALAMGIAMPLLVLGSGALLLRLVTHDVHTKQDARLRERAAVLLPTARGLLRVEGSGRPQRVANQERRLLDAGLDIGVRLVATDDGAPSGNDGGRPGNAGGGDGSAPGRDGVPGGQSTAGQNGTTGSQNTAGQHDPTEGQNLLGQNGTGGGGPVTSGGQGAGGGQAATAGPNAVAEPPPYRVVAAAGPQPGADAVLPSAAPDPMTVRAHGHTWRALSVEVNIGNGGSVGNSGDGGDGGNDGDGRNGGSVGNGGNSGISGNGENSGNGGNGGNGRNASSGRRGTLWVFSRGSAGKSEADAVQGRILLVALIAAPLTGLLSLAIAEHATRPLRRLQRRAGGLDPRTSAARLDHSPSRITEVDDLARTLQTVLTRYDEQAARTQEALATARAFSATASHELRTPLMGMQTNLDVLTDHPDLDPADRAEVLADLHAGHRRLMDMLIALRALAQGDLVEADAFADVDLSELVAAAVADVERHHPGVRLTLDLTPGLHLSAWEPGLRMAVDNLLRNAVVHGSRPGATARIEVALRPGGRPGDPVAVLTVDDDGPGVAPQERAQVFERFHRRADSPGSGLGLTLVAQQIALHRGTVGIVDRMAGTGTRFEVRLPRLDAAETDTRTLELPLRRDWLSQLPAPGSTPV
ncbi:sensor histidine kinase [Streptomyces sp. NPDC056411]|uniref:sensor histidine kinase n=1 Tax=Streptomyces sp. NPDC056411 TaxID=3345813 RepID=UPI0035DA864B